MFLFEAYASKAIQWNLVGNKLEHVFNESYVIVVSYSKCTSEGIISCEYDTKGNLKRFINSAIIV